MIKTTFMYLFLFIIFFKSFSQKTYKKKPHKDIHTKVANFAIKKKVVGSAKTSCPVKIERKQSNLESIAFTSIKSKAHIRRSSTSVHFDVVQLEDIHLEIPAFKQFKNNMTDFTADGEHQFQQIITKIAVFLGTNHEGKGVGLKITGSASQIPTSFDPGLPNFNINKDGSSIIGKTSIKNNSKLAKARADELAKKIKAVFPSIEIETPNLADIKIGETKWTWETQQNLNTSVIKKDKLAIKKIYEPFQKDQWVKVESKERSSKSVKPESLKMYMVSTSPSLHKVINNKNAIINSVFIVSKNTYHLIGENLHFNSIEARDDYFLKHKFELFNATKNGFNRWYLLHGDSEINAFKTSDATERVFNLFEVDIIDALDEEILEAKITQDLKFNP